MAHISRERALLIDRDRARREFRHHQVRAFLEHVNGRFAAYRRAIIAATHNDVEAFERGRQEIIDNAILTDTTFFGVMDDSFMQAGKQFTAADQSMRAGVVTMTVRPATSQADVEFIEHQLNELDKLLSPLLLAVIAVNRAAENYVFQQALDEERPES